MFCWYILRTFRSADVNNGINTRRRLKRHDPQLSALLEQAFGDGSWRFTETAPSEFLPVGLRRWDPYSQPFVRCHMHCSALWVRKSPYSLKRAGSWHSLNLKWQVREVWQERRHLCYPAKNLGICGSEDGLYKGEQQSVQSLEIAISLREVLCRRQDLANDLNAHSKRLRSELCCLPTWEQVQLLICESPESSCHIYWHNEKSVLEGFSPAILDFPQLAHKGCMMIVQCNDKQRHNQSISSSCSCKICYWGFQALCSWHQRGSEADIDAEQDMLALHLTDEARTGSLHRASYRQQEPFHRAANDHLNILIRFFTNTRYPGLSNFLPFICKVFLSPCIPLPGFLWYLKTSANDEPLVGIADWSRASKK